MLTYRLLPFALTILKLTFDIFVHSCMHILCTMYVCLSIFVHGGVYVCMLYAYACMYACKYALRLTTCIVCVYVCIRLYVHMYICMYLYVYVCKNLCIYSAK